MLRWCCSVMLRWFVLLFILLFIVLPVWWYIVWLPFSTDCIWVLMFGILLLRVPVLLRVVCRWYSFIVLTVDCYCSWPDLEVLPFGAGVCSLHSHLLLFALTLHWFLHSTGRALHLFVLLPDYIDDDWEIFFYLFITVFPISTTVPHSVRYEHSVHYGTGDTNFYIAVPCDPSTIPVAICYCYRHSTMHWRFTGDSDYIPVFVLVKVLMVMVLRGAFGAGALNSTVLDGRVLRWVAPLLPGVADPFCCSRHWWWALTIVPTLDHHLLLRCVDLLGTFWAFLVLHYTTFVRYFNFYCSSCCYRCYLLLPMPTVVHWR